MIPPINEKPRLESRTKETKKEPDQRFKRWYSQSNANDSNIEDHRIQFRPHNMTNMEDMLLLASEEFDLNKAGLKKNAYDGGALKIPAPEHDLHQYSFDFLKHPLPHKDKEPVN